MEGIEEKPLKIPEILNDKTLFKIFKGFTHKIYLNVAPLIVRLPNINSFPKFQSQISSKLSEILNVIDMLNGIIGKDVDEEVTTKKKTSKKPKKSESDSSPERIKSELLESMKKKKKDAEDK